MERTIEMPELRVLAIQEDDGRWSAQCLEHDIVCQSARLADLHNAFAKTICAYIALSIEAGEDPLANVEPAPREFFDLYDAAFTDITTRAPSIMECPVPVPPAQFRVAELSVA